MAAPTYYFELSSVYSRSEATRISTFNFKLWRPQVSATEILHKNKS